MSRKKGLPKWIVSLLVGLFGSKVFIETVDEAAQKRIDRIEDQKQKATWQWVKNNGLNTVQILTNDNPDNREEFEDLLDRNVDLIIGLGVEPLRNKGMTFAYKKKYSDGEKATLNKFFKDLEEEAKSFDIIEHVTG